VKTQRTLAVLAAVLFVGAVALATSGTQMLSLGAALAAISDTAEQTVHDWLVRFVGPWVWIEVVEPLLVRPAWLPVGSLGLVFAGLAASWPTGGAARRSHRRS
jgi:uncharacterized membrane protein